MVLNTLPAGWSPDQLNALNNLAPMVEALALVNQVSQLVNDVSADAAQVRSDLVALVSQTWTQVKAYPEADQ